MEASIESLQGQPHSITPIKIEIYDQEGHGSLPTPDISPGELSESSDELVIIQGDFLDEVRSVDQVQPLQIQYGSFPEAGVDAAVTGDASQNGEAVAGPLSWLTESPFIDALVNWIEGPENPGLQKSNEKEKPNPWLDIPLQFIALLTYPEPDPKNGNKMTLALVRETAFVRQRRKTLMMLTLYTLLVRYCSFDTFIAILFASNCAMLFLMKNSGRMNVNMAKRAVRQRVGWAKQWAGSIFKRGGGGGGNNNNNTNSAGISNSHSGSSTSQHLGAGASSSSASNINRQIQSSALSGGVVASPTLTPDNSSQMKRRGLFGKRKTVDNASTIQVASSSSSRVFTPSIASGAQDKYAVTGDGASIISAAPTGATSGTQKKRFFRRGNTSNSTSNGNSGNTISSTSASTASAPVPIPSKRNTLSIISHTAPQHLGPSTSATKSAITNTPLSSSPLAQSHSFKSPMSHEGEMDRVDSKWTMSQSMVSTPPPPLSGINLTQNSKGSITSQDSTTTSSLSSPGASSGQSTPITCESVAMPIPASTPLMVSGLSQLLGRSYPTATKDRSLIERGHWEDNSARGYDGHEEEQRVNASRGKDIGSISFHNEMETMSKHSHGGRDNAKANLTLDAVTSASAESMEGV
ncbi:hypothetical protein BGZ46_008279 [Entomortierella lignicola]|nr:hypothetical protein BGZ46_008279 [Entomortierella lignicola]